MSANPPSAAHVEGPPISGRRLALAFLVFSLFHAAVFWHFGPQFVDDAYITFRYAERIAAGDGFTFNDNLAVLGTTTPLWTLLLAACRVLGLPMTFAVGLLSSLAAGWLCLALWRLLARFGLERLGVLAGPALLVYERWLWVFLMGMETVLSVAIIVAILERIATRRERGIGLLGALAVLARPDGAVVAAFGLLAAWTRGRRPGVRETAAFALVLAPWMLFALFTFGSPIPHSIAVKQIIHPLGFQDALAGAWGGLWGDVFGRIVCVLGCVGVAAVALRMRSAWAVAVWVAAFGLGLGASGVNIKLFPWYIPPLAAGLWILTLLGLGWAREGMADALEKAGRRPFGLPPRRCAGILLAGLFLAIVFQSSGFLSRYWREFPEAFTDKEKLYLGSAKELSYQFYDRNIILCLIDPESPEYGITCWVPPQPKILVGEVGVYGYILTDCEILDSSGINSPAIAQLRREDSEGKGAWIWKALEDLQPDLVVTLSTFDWAELIIAHPDLAPDYERIHLPTSDRAGLLLLRRKEFAWKGP